MTRSRREFLQLSAGVATAAAMSWPVGARSFESLPQESDRNFIRLNSNENAYGPSAKVADAIRSSIGGVNRYPQMEYHALAEHIAGVHHLNASQVLPGCGSTEILRAAAFAFLGNGNVLVQASPTYQAIEDYARTAGSDVLAVPLTTRFAHDLDGMLSRLNGSTTLVYICNPNNPTATLTPRGDLESFIGKLPASTFVVIDEAYHHYAGRSGMYASFIDRPVDNERVIVTRTFSAVYGLAGLRLGYAVGSPRVMQQMGKFVAENSVNTLATGAAGAALDDDEGVKAAVQRNADDRQEFFNQAMARALKPIDSQANFVMMNTDHPAAELIEYFHKNNILIGRRFPAMDTFIRVSLGRPEEMLAFWSAWDKLPFAKNMKHHH